MVLSLMGIALQKVLMIKEVDMIATISTDKAPAAIGPYSQAKTVGGFLFASGQIPIDPATGELAGTEIKAQTEQVLKNIDAVLQEAGAGPNKVVKTLCFLADMDDFAAFNEVYAGYFTDKPARSAIGVKALPKGALVEVEVIAYLG
jgi:2-iminobutanoate/2-iminopropanoate deaminase